MTGIEYYIPQYQTERCSTWVSLSRNATVKAASERLRKWAANPCVTKLRLLAFDPAADEPECCVIGCNLELYREQPRREAI